MQFGNKGVGLSQRSATIGPLQSEDFGGSIEYNGAVPTRIYLDNAATTWPKPEAVYRAVDDYQRRLGAPAGRSAYAEAAETEKLVESARAAVARLINAEHARQVIFTCNGTDALNLAIAGALQPGDHAVTTAVEHNSVLRPLRHFEGRAEPPRTPPDYTGRGSVSRVACGADGIVDPDAMRAALRPNTRLIALVHASNVTGALQPIHEVGQFAREHGALLLVDAAQTLGHVPIDVQALPVDLLAAPGHKGLLGPLGTGILYIRPDVEKRLRSLRQGGTGSRSEEDRQPEFLPDKFEAGNLNAAGIIGLGAGVAYVLEKTVAALRQHDQLLTARLLTGLAEIPHVVVYGPRDAEKQVGVVSFNIGQHDPQEVAAMLDAAYRIQVRSGLHCAPLMHKSLGTLQGGGTVRFSLGPFNDAGQIDAAISAVREIAAAVARIRVRKAKRLKNWWRTDGTARRYGLAAPGFETALRTSVITAWKSSRSRIPSKSESCSASAAWR